MSTEKQRARLAEATLRGEGCANCKHSLGRTRKAGGWCTICVVEKHQRFIEATTPWCPRWERGFPSDVG